MLDEICIPKITTTFDAQTEQGIHTIYGDAIRNTLQKILPLEVFAIREADADFLADQREHFHAVLPLISYHLETTEKATNLSFYALHKYRSNAFKFFFELISYWLVPGKRLNVTLVYAVDFSMPELGNDLYTLCEIMLNVDNSNDLEEIQSNLPIIASEIRLGVESSYYARRILEVKGLSPDEKTVMIQEYAAYLMRRLPKSFDLDVLSEMQHVLVICRDDFKAVRSARHLSRIISVQYLFRKSIREAVKQVPEKRHLSLKLFKARLRGTDGEKVVLGVLVALNFLKEQEIFEKKHLMTAIQNYLPSAEAVEDSFFANRRGTENICTVYIEIQKNDGKDFTKDEIRYLRQELPIDLKDRIEHLMHPVFMPRNEEEIMRNVLSLSSQIKYMRDIPQVTISFDEQTYSSLFFTVILVRVLKPGAPTILEQFQNSETILDYIHDRCKVVGHLRKKYLKEATVFRIKVTKDNYLRKDRSIDLFKTRQFVVSELNRILGEFRDFNGGIISKQNELLCGVRDLLGNKIKYNDLLLENFFYSLLPVSMRTIMEPIVLKHLFLMQIKAIEKGFFSDEALVLKIEQEANYVYVMIKAQDRLVQEEVSHLLSSLKISSTDIANTHVKVYDIFYIGYVYRCDDPRKQTQFCNKIKKLSEKPSLH